MGDTMTLYAGGKETVIALNAQPDPGTPGHYLLKSEDGAPMRCKLSLKDHAYNIVLPPDSYIIIEADEAQVLKDSRSDDCVVFILPSEDSKEFYTEQYFTSAKGQQPFTAVVLRNEKTHKMVSAALYPRDLEKLPPPSFNTLSGRAVMVAVRGAASSPDAKVESAHSPRELESILKAIYETKSAVDLKAPKESWF